MTNVRMPDHRSTGVDCHGRQPQWAGAIVSATISAGSGRDHGAAVARIAPCLGRRGAGSTHRPAQRRCGWPCCLPATAFTASNGGPRAKANTWNSARCSRRSTDFREKLLFIRGLYNAEALKGNIHSSQTGNLLSGAPLASGGEIRSGTSVDQLLAQTYGRSTKVPSLVLACEKSNPSVHKNYSMLYSSHISWTSPTTPTPLELYPALAFDRLFKDERERGDKSVLDAVLDDAGDLRRQISTADQRKLDEYLDSVREVEQRIEQAGKQANCRAGGRRWTSRTCRGRRTAFRRTSPNTCG